MSEVKTTRIFSGYGAYCSREALWTVDRFDGGSLRGAYYEVRVFSEALVAGHGIFGATTSVRQVAQWLIEHGVPPVTCNYCDQPATRRVIDATDEVVCRGCARSQTDGPLRDYVRPLTGPQGVRLLSAALLRS